VGYGGGGPHKPGVLWQRLDPHKICSALTTGFPLLLLPRPAREMSAGDFMAQRFPRYPFHGGGTAFLDYTRIRRFHAGLTSCPAHF
jgi:hypothetical protein